MTSPGRGLDGTRPRLGRLAAVPVRTAARRPASAISGTDLSGQPTERRLTSAGAWTLLLFLSSHCDGCAPFWAVPRSALGLVPAAGDALVVVSHDSEREDADAVSRWTRAATDPVDVVMASAAWRAYGVLGPPFFVLVEGPEVATEGVAWSAEQVAADVRRARAAPSPASA